MSVTTTTLPLVSVSDEMIVNADGSTSRQTVQALAVQLASSGAISDALTSLLATGMVGYATAAELPTDPEPATGTLAQVTNDPTDSNNGVWRYDGAEWVQGVDRIGPIAAELEAIDSRWVRVDDVDDSLLPILADPVSGGAPVFLRDGALGAAALSVGLQGRLTVEEIDDSYPAAVWTINGRAYAAQVGDEMVWYGAVASAAPEPAPAPQVPLSTDGAGLSAWRQKRARIDAGESAVARVMIMGDSHTERYFVPAAVRAALVDQWGASGSGWIGLNSDLTALQAPLGGVTFSKAGWSLSDMGAGSLALDGFALTASSATASVTITGLSCTEVWHWYLDVVGVHRIAVDGGTPIVIEGTGSGEVVRHVVSGLSASAPHSVVIDTVGNAGTVQLHGIYAASTAAGVEFSKAGNGGSTAADFEAMWSGPLPGEQIAAIAPQIIIYSVGTNDRTAGVAAADFEAAVRAWVASVHAAVPRCGVILVPPPRNGESASPSLSVYRDAMAAIAASTDGVDMVNIHDLMDTYSAAAADGLWYDSRHPSAIAGSIYAAAIKRLMEV